MPFFAVAKRVFGNKADWVLEKYPDSGGMELVIRFNCDLTPTDIFQQAGKVGAEIEHLSHWKYSEILLVCYAGSIFTRKIHMHFTQKDK